MLAKQDFYMNLKNNFKKIQPNWANWLHPTSEEHLESFKNMLIQTKCFEKRCKNCSKLTTFVWRSKKRDANGVIRASLYQHCGKCR